VAGSAPCATAAPSAAALSAAAAAAGVVLVGGSVPERDAAGKLYNSALVFDAAGRVLAKHRKARRAASACALLHC
jgi:predicted amidohydrolase